MIDQAHIVIKHRRGKNAWTLEIIDRLQGLGIDERKIIDFQMLRLPQQLSCMTNDPIGIVLFCGLDERSENAGCVFTVGCAESDIAR